MASSDLQGAPVSSDSGAFFYFLFITFPVSIDSPKIRFYVDALNLYNRLARIYGIKWIDVEKLLLAVVKNKFPNATAEKILIFTAHILEKSETTETPEMADILSSKLKRQKLYLEALKTHSPSTIEIILGSFKYVSKTGNLVIKGEVVNSLAKVRVREEKRTDVNIACRIVEDAYISRDAGAKTDYDMCCLVSNDSDIAYALEVKKKLEQRMLLITPLIVPRSKKARVYASVELREFIETQDQILTIKRKLVAACQLPDTVGNFSKPAEWGEIALPTSG